MSLNKGTIIGAIIALYSVLSIYAFPFLIKNMGVALLYFVVAPLLLLEYFKKRIIIIKSQRILFVYICYLVLITIFMSHTISKSTIALIISATIYTLLFSYDGFFSSLLKLYIRLSFLFSIFLIIQFVAFVFLGIEIPGVVSFLPLYEEETTNGIIETFSFIRLSSVFKEPSHFALFVVPSVSIIINNSRYKPLFKGLFLGIITIAIILSTSGNGIIMLAISYLLYPISNMFKKRNFSFKRIVLLAIIVTLGIYLYKSSSLISDITQNMFVNENGGNSKASYRIYRGFQLFSDVPSKYHFFGIGWKNAEVFLKAQYPSIYSSYVSESTFDYFNSIAAILLYSGYFGALLFIGFIRKLIKECRTNTSRAIIILLLVSMFSSSIFMTDQWLLYLGLIYATSNKNLITQKRIV